MQLNVINTTTTFNNVLKTLPPKKGWEGYFLFFTGSYFRIQDEKEILYIKKNEFIKKWSNSVNFNKQIITNIFNDIFKQSPTLLPVYTIRSWLKMPSLINKTDFIDKLPKSTSNANQKPNEILQQSTSNANQKPNEILQLQIDVLGMEILSIDTNQPTKWDSIALERLNEVFQKHKNTKLTAENLISLWAESLHHNNPNKDNLNNLLNLEFKMLEIEDLLDSFNKEIKGSSN